MNARSRWSVMGRALMYGAWVGAVIGGPIIGGFCLGGPEYAILGRKLAPVTHVRRCFRWISPCRRIQPGALPVI